MSGKNLYLIKISEFITNLLNFRVVGSQSSEINFDL